MPCCEKCWTMARSRHRKDMSKSNMEHYYIVMKEVEDSGIECTPKQKAGQFWDEEKQCDNRIWR